MGDIKIGSFVKSKQGRDKDNIYIVKEIFENSAVLVDGFGKKLNNPKTKNLKHIQSIGIDCKSIADKFLANKKVFDEEIYSAIKKINIK